MFAERGYMGCKMEDIAEQCGVSKSMLYHYFKRKEDVLFEIVQGHILRLNRMIEGYLREADCTNPRRFFAHFIDRYLEVATRARGHHAVTVGDSRWLMPDQLAAQQHLEKQNTDLIIQILKRLNPHYSTREYSVYALLLKGTIHWIELRHHGSSTVSRAELYDRATALFLDGFLKTYGDGSKVRPALKDNSRSRRPHTVAARQE
jgi:AcrR family transcriptional regulator